MNLQCWLPGKCNRHFKWKGTVLYCICSWHLGRPDRSQFLSLRAQHPAGCWLGTAKGGDSLGEKGLHERKTWLQSQLEILITVCQKMIGFFTQSVPEIPWFRTPASEAPAGLLQQTFPRFSCPGCAPLDPLSHLTSRVQVWRASDNCSGTDL